MAHVIGDPRKAGEAGAAGDQRKAGEAGPAGDTRAAGEENASKQKSKPPKRDEPTNTDASANEASD